jgi:AcrR family transcriptional regulator
MTATRQRIAETSLRLFNAHTTSEVSTNHVALSMNISPGNLYYHYRSKEQIVEALFTELERRVTFAWRVPDPSELRSCNLGELFAERLAAFAEFIFIVRELFTLPRIYPSLAEPLSRFRQERLAGLEHLLEALVSAGRLSGSCSPHRQRLARTLWLLSQASLADHELYGTGSNGSIRAAAEQMLGVIDAYVLRERDDS